VKTIPLEDSAKDVLSKALAIAALSPLELEKKAGGKIADALTAPETPAHRLILSKAAEILRLDPASFLDLACGHYQPNISPPERLLPFSNPYGDILVNSYLAWDEVGNAIFFDTGADIAPVLAAISRHPLTLRRLFITHAHGDHILETDRLCEKTGCKVSISKWEPIDGAETFSPGEVFHIGALKIETRLTRGHSPGGTTYVIHGLAKPVAVVGDALFAGSMGRPNVSAEDAFSTNLKEIFSLPDETILCPGHGPLTTVKLEKAHNPFFAAKFRK